MPSVPRRAPRATPGSSLVDRFWEKVDKTGDCWLWLGAIMPTGYGELSPPKHLQQGNRHPLYAHRISFELAYGAIPDGLQIDHLCRNRACVNPAHLQAVTPKENKLRGYSPSAMAARRTHCIHGHEFSGRNLYVRKDGSRFCRACGRIYQFNRRRRLAVEQG